MSYRDHLINQSRHPSDPAYDPPPEPEYFLVGKPHGSCPWCSKPLQEPDCEVSSVSDPDGLYPRDSGTCEEDQWWCDCDDWAFDDSETENRIRYAADRLADAQVRQP